MGFHRKNIGSLHQMVYIVGGLAGALLAFVYLTGFLAVLGSAAGIGLALSGVVGYCPVCAVSGLGRRGP